MCLAAKLDTHVELPHVFLKIGSTSFVEILTEHDFPHIGHVCISVTSLNMHFIRNHAGISTSEQLSRNFVVSHISAYKSECRNMSNVDNTVLYDIRWLKTTKRYYLLRGFLKLRILSFI